MRSRMVPYSTSPGRLLAQLFSDVVVTGWTLIWLLVGAAVHTAIAAIAAVGRQVQNGALGVAGNLESVSVGTARMPLIGDAVREPLSAASAAASEIAAAGQNLDSTASWLAVVLAVAVAAPPIGALAVPWLILRLRFFRRKRAVLALADTAAGEQLLALRALTGGSLLELSSVSPDPVAGWRHQDPYTIQALAALELRRAGLARARGGAVR